MSVLGGIAVIGTTPLLGERGARACERVGAQVIGWRAADGAELAAAIDAAARRDDVAAVLVVADEIRAPREVREVAARASRFLPIVLHCYADGDEAGFSAWTRAVGLVRLPSLSACAAGLLVACALEAPPERRVKVVGECADARATLSAVLGRAGLAAEEAAGSDWESALGDLSFDAVFIAGVADRLDAEQVAALGVARERHPELPVVLIADGPADALALLAHTLSPHAIAVLSADVDLAGGLRVLREWTVAKARMATAVEARDVTRIRRGVRELRRGAPMFAPEVQGELAGGLGVPFSVPKRASYLEDALIAAADVGYPVRTAVVHGDLHWPSTPRWEVSVGSAEMLAAGEAELARARRTHGPEAELLVARAQPDSAVGEVAARRDPRWGVLVRVAFGGEDVCVASPFTSADVVFRSLPAETATALAGTAQAAAGVLASAEEVEEVALSVEVGRFGCMTRHVGVVLTEAR